MNLQDAFYLVGIITFVLASILIASATVMLFLLKRRMDKLEREIILKVKEFRNTAFEVGEFGGVLAGKVLSKISKLFNKEEDYYALE